MSFKNGEILISPKIVTWIMPYNTIDDNIIMDFLKKDIYIKKVSVENQNIINFIKGDNSSTLFIINLDEYKNPDSYTLKEYHNECRQFCKQLKKIKNKKIIIHSRINDNITKSIYKKNKILYFSASGILNDKSDFFSVLYKYIISSFKLKKRPLRSSIRIYYFPSRLNKVEIIKISNNTIKSNAYLKDISINGVGLISTETEKLKLFNIGDHLQLTIYLQKNIINILNTTVARINNKENLIGVEYSINDFNMITKNDADNIIKIIYSWLSEYLRYMSNIS